MKSKIALESDEEIIEERRKHPIVLFGPFFKIFLAFLLVILIFFLFGASIAFSIAFFLWLIFGGIFGFYHYHIWHRDHYILTNSRLIIKEQQTFFSREVREANLDEITDVTYHIKGFWATLFNFGTVRAETASADALKLAKISHPAKMQKLILELRSRYIKSK